MRDAATASSHLARRRAEVDVGKPAVCAGFTTSGEIRENAWMPALPITGGCNCGAVRYEVTAELLGASYCHCRRCQRRSGAAASPSAHAAVDSFRILSGDDVLKCWKPEDGGEKWFCGACGSSVFARNLDKHPEWVGVRMGTFDDDPGVRPSVRSWVGSAAAWEPIPDDGLPRHIASRYR